MIPRLPALVALFLCASACDSNSKLTTMDDYDLAQRYGQCLDKKPTAPGRILACENLRKECERRRSELGSFVCRSS